MGRREASGDSMTTPAKLNELKSAEHPAREELARIGYAYVPCEALAAERAVV